MGLESATYLASLVSANPVGASDQVSQGDDHIRLMKQVLQNTFPNMAGAAWRVQDKGAGYTVLTTDNMTIINCTAALTLAYSAVATLANQHLTIVLANGGAVTIDPNSSETINGAATLVVPQTQAAIVVCDGTLLRAVGLNIGIPPSLTLQNIFTKTQSWAKGADVATAGALTLGTDGNYFVLTGSTTITSIGTLGVGTRVLLQTAAAPLFTHHATDLILPGSANIQAVAGDVFEFVEYATGDWKLVNFESAGGLLGTVHGFTAQQYFAQATLADAASIAWDLDAGQAAIVTLGGNRTLANPTNQKAGASYTLIVKQDATGSRTLAYGSAYKFPGGTAPTLSTAANAVDVLCFISDGTNMLGTAQFDFS